MKLKSYKLYWEEVTIPRSSINVQGKTLLIGNTDLDSILLFKKFTSFLGDENVIICRLGEYYDNKNYKQFEIDTKCPENISRLVQRMKEIRNIIFFPMLKQQDFFSSKDLNVSQEKGIFVFFELLKILMKQPSHVPVKNILLLSNEGVNYSSSSSSEINPFEATSKGFLKAARNETSSITLTSIDISYNEIKEINIELVLKIFTSLNNQDIILKQNKCYKEFLYKTSFNNSDKIEPHIISNGNYLIVGGGSGIGEQIAYFLSENYKANIQIIGRRKKNNKIVSILNKINELGGHGEYFNVDILDFDKLQKTIENINFKYGRINGVFSNAVVLADSLIINMTFDNFQKVLRTKTEGTLNLAKLFFQKTPDFICFNSTFNSYYANEGQTNYVAASCFLDSYANYLYSKNWPIKIINWGYWGDLGVGMSPEIKSILQSKGVYPIDIKEGIKALDQFINSNNHQLFLLKISQELEEQLQIKSYNMEEHFEEPLKSNINSIPQIEQKIIQILSQELSLDEKAIGKKTPFSDLGVDSIMSHTIIDKINKSLNTQLKVSDIFNYSNVEELENYIKNRLINSETLIDNENNVRFLTESQNNENFVENETDVTKNNDSINYSNSDLEKTIIQIVSHELNLDEKAIGKKTPFSDLGVDSIMSHTIIDKINKSLNTQLKVSDIFNYSNVEELENYIKNRLINPEISIDNENKVQFLTESQNNENIVKNKTYVTKNYDSIDYSNSDLEKTIIQIVSHELNLDEKAIGKRIPFSDLGIDSIMSHTIIDKINKSLNIQLKVSDIFNYSNVEELENYIRGQIIVPEKIIVDDIDNLFKKISQNNVNEIKIKENSNYSNLSIEKTIIRILSQELGLDEKVIISNTPFSDLGVDSIMSHKIIDIINKSFNTQLKVSDIFNYSTVEELKNYIENQKNKLSNPEKSFLSNETTKDSKQPITPQTQNYNDEDIAIIGMSGVFAGANSTDELWEILQKGETLVNEIPFDRWDANKIYDENILKEGTINSKWGAFINSPDMFDPLFFKISPKEAKYMDPQQRLFLREGWKAFEDSGYTEQKLAGKKVGIYVGVASGGYENIILESQQPNAQTFIGNANSIVPARLSYYFNLSGPSLAIDTACSSSLVALNIACQAIKANECEMALVGGACIISTSEFYLKATKAGMLSPTGKCHTFDESADGFVPGEAVAAIVLKPVKKALEDKDQIYGIIKGVAVNQDGKSNGITAPSGKAQIDLIKDLYKKINITPDTISYIEAHGTGTKLGDPVEINSLSKIYNQRKSYIGSIKTNLGHTLTSAGVVGLIKILLCFKNETLVPSINYKTPNKLLELEKHNFEIVTEPIKWSRNGTVRRAAVSSFGFSGTNSHAIIEDYVSPPIINKKQVSELFLFSSKTIEQLKRLVNNFKDYLIKRPNISLLNIAYTLSLRRNWYDIRLAFIASSHEDLLQQINIILDRFEVAEPPKNHLPDISNIIESVIENANTVDVITDRNKELNYLSSFYLSGYTFNLEKLFKNRECNTISLPHYEFEESSYWISKTQKQTFIKLSSKKEENHLLYIKNKWEEIQDKESIDKAVFNNQSILLIYNSEYLTQSKELYYQLLQLFTNEEYIDFQCLQKLQVNEDSNYDVVLDMSDFFGEKSDELYYVQLQLLQKIITTDSQTKILHFINNESIVANNYLAQGFYKMLSSEYSKVDASSILIDNDSRLQLPNIIKKEIYQTNLYGLYKYQKNKKYKNSIYEVNIQANLNKNELNINGIYAISGGLGDIGFEVCKYLIHSGVKNIALISERNLNQTDSINSDKIKLKKQRLDQLKKSGENIFVYTGELTEKTKLIEFTNEIEKNTGLKIKGFIHCAGIVKSNNPSFKNKDIAGIKNLQNPKYQGLLNLASVFSEVDLFIVFSSISSLFPHLAVGVSDYSSVNYFMDKYIDYLCKANPKTRYVSIEWNNWISTQMGAKVSSSKISEMGISGYSHKRGIKILNQIITSNLSGTIAPIIAENIRNDWDKLIKLRPEIKQALNEKINGNAILYKDSDLCKEKDLSRLIKKLTNIFSSGLKIPIEKLDLNTRFNDFGIDSILIAELVLIIEKELNIKLNPTILIEYPSINLLANYLNDNLNNLVLSSENDEKQNSFNSVKSSYIKEKKVAIVGMACNFPGANNIYEYWNNLINKIVSIKEIPESRWKISDFYSSDKQPNKSYVKVGGFIPDIDLFDYDFFNISKEDAKHFDPLVRQVLENSIQLLCSAGYTKQELKGTSTGVYIGSRISDYAKEINPYNKNSIIGIGQNFIAAYLSHYLDLKGPSLVIDSACSSSLVSVHQAIQAIKSGDCSQAIAGGVDILLNEKPYLLLSASKALSESGLCKTFDKDADGFIPGEGCGLVLLKDLEKAIEDGDIIYAVIESSAVNNDGNTMGVTTPDFESQYKVIRKALDKAHLSSEDIECVEVHGTGTMIGDPIELKALTKAFREDTDKKQFCGIGSVKSNFGHLLSAAGIASFIKMVLSIYNNYMLPTLNCENPNERFDFKNSPFYILYNAQPWNTTNIKRGGISAFGFGGTNCHLILRESLEIEKKHQTRKPLELHNFNKKKVWVKKDESTEKKNSIKEDLNTILKIEEI